MYGMWALSIFKLIKVHQQLPYITNLIVYFQLPTLNTTCTEQDHLRIRFLNRTPTMKVLSLESAKVICIFVVQTKTNLKLTNRRLRLGQTIISCSDLGNVQFIKTKY